MLKHRPLISKGFFQKKDQCLLHLLELLLGLLLTVIAADRVAFNILTEYSSFTKKGQAPVCYYLYNFACSVQKIIKSVTEGNPLGRPDEDKSFRALKYIVLSFRL
jgi:hypothetical protein